MRTVDFDLNISFDTTQCTDATKVIRRMEKTMNHFLLRNSSTQSANFMFFLNGISLSLLSLPGRGSSESCRKNEAGRYPVDPKVFAGNSPLILILMAPA